MRFATLVGVCLLPAAGALAQMPKQLEPVKNPEAGRRLAQIEVVARQESASRAAGQLLELLEDPKEAHRVGEEPAAGRALATVGAQARELAQRLAEEVPAFRREWESRAREQMLRLGVRPARAGLELLASRFRGTEAARAALRTLADQAWEAGDLARAAWTWERMGRHVTATEAAKAALARRRTGLGPSTLELVAWAAEHGVGGLKAPCLKGWYPSADEPLPARGGTTTRRRLLEATGRAAVASPWQGELNASHLPFPEMKALDGPGQTWRCFAPDEEPLGLRTGVHFNNVNAYEGASPLRPFPMPDGSIWFPADRSASSLRLEAQGRWVEALTGTIRSPLSLSSGSTDGRLVFLVGTSGGRDVLCALAPDGTRRWVATPPRAEDRDDLTEAEMLFSEAHFSGPPLLVAGRLYVPAAIVDTTVVACVFSFDAADGRLLWATPVGEGDPSMFTAHDLRPASPLTLAGGRLLFCTNAGLLAALDPESGLIEWIFSYLPEGGLGWIEGPPLADGGRAFFTPLDTSRGFILDARSGRLLETVQPSDGAESHFRYPFASRGRLGVAGVLDRVATGDHARGLVKILNGPGVRSVSYELPEPPAGRPGLAGSILYVPTQKAVYALDLRDGTMDVLHAWELREPPGDLVRLPGWLAVVQKGDVTLFKVRD